MITCLGKIARAKLSMTRRAFLPRASMLVHRKQKVGVAADHVVDCQGDTAPQDPNFGKRSVDNCPLSWFDVRVPGTFDLVQQPAQSAMSPDEAGGRALCILPEIYGTAASIDGAAIIAEAVAPRSGERSQLVNSIKAPSKADCWRRHAAEANC